MQEFRDGFLQGMFHPNRLYRVRQKPFFLENDLKKTTKYFLKFLSLFESTILPVNNGK